MFGVGELRPVARDEIKLHIFAAERAPAGQIGAPATHIDAASVRDRRHDADRHHRSLIRRLIILRGRRDPAAAPSRVRDEAQAAWQFESDFKELHIARDFPGADVRYAAQPSRSKLWSPLSFAYAILLAANAIPRSSPRSSASPLIRPSNE